MSYQTDVAEEWRRFLNGDPLDKPRAVRPGIFASWRRCIRHFRGKDAPPAPVLSAQALRPILEANHEIIRTADPIMREYEDFFVKECGALLLASADGVLLHGVGDNALLRSDGFRVGTVLTEDSQGTNAVGLCLREQAHVDVLGHEHFASRLQAWGCDAEPLRGGKRRILGILVLVLPLRGHHASASALLHAIVSNINNLHHVHDLLSDQDTVLEILNEGIIILDKLGGIKAANAQARRMLGIPHQDPAALGRISDYVRDGEPFMGILKRKKPVMDEESTLPLAQTRLRCILSASFIGENKGVVCTLAESERMQKYAVRTAGSKAIYTFADILGASDVIGNALQLAEMAAQSDITTLLLGESGTGKELFAHAIHNAGNRKHGPFIVVNCGALPRDLVQSELFGYEAGAFTGAMKNGKPGKFELADGGTIFLDEIGEMPLEAQTNLLRLIQNKEVSRVGGTITKTVNVRILAATNRNLPDAVARGTFRSDLYYRLSVLVINIPALRDRPTDIPALAGHFLRTYAEALNRPPADFSPDAMRALTRHAWPGNIRELENVVERMVNICHKTRIERADLPDFLRGPAPRSADIAEVAAAGIRREKTPVSNLYEHERQVIMDTLTRCNGNMCLSARELGIARSALYAKLARFGIDHAPYRKKYR